MWSIKEHEFPWHCALLKKDGSYHGCGAVLLRFHFGFLVFEHFSYVSFAAANQKSSLQRQRTALWGDTDDAADAFVCFETSTLQRIKPGKYHGLLWSPTSQCKHPKSHGSGWSPSAGNRSNARIGYSPSLSFLKGFAPRELPMADSAYPNSWGEQWSPFWSWSLWERHCHSESEWDIALQEEGDMASMSSNPGKYSRTRTKPSTNSILDNRTVTDKILIGFSNCKCWSKAESVYNISTAFEITHFWILSYRAQTMQAGQKLD